MDEARLPFRPDGGETLTSQFPVGQGFPGHMGARAGRTDPLQDEAAGQGEVAAHAGMVMVVGDFPGGRYALVQDASA